MNIADIAKKFHDKEIEESGDQGTEYGGQAWAFVFRQLTFAEVTELDAKGVEFIFTDNSNDPLWEKVQDLLNFWEEWSCGALCEDIAQACDEKTPLADPQVWDWMIQHIAFSREDYAFCLTLLEMGDADNELCYIFFGGSSYGTIANDPRYHEFTAIVPGYDPVPLYTRLDAAHTLWNTTLASRGEEWKRAL